MDTTAPRFEHDVIEASNATPVLVDFWAPWCGPCRVLGPTLERLEAEAAGRWRLVKLNVDEAPELSARYGIQGIPAVKLFSEGAVVDEFVGALPDYAVAQWLEKALPSENKKLLGQAERALDAGETEEAETLLLRILDAEPEHPQARVMLARLVVFEHPEQALSLLGGGAFAGSSYVQTEEAVRTVARLLALREAPERLPDGPAQAAYLEAIEAVARRDFDAALSGFIGVVRTHRPYDDDGARKACIALFHLLGAQHEVTRRHRRAFDTSLY